LDDLI
jgi:hypothetical protein